MIKAEGWTHKAVPIEADSLDEMREALTAILQDIDRYGIRDAKTGEVVDDTSEQVAFPTD
jgi:hypothetical protein